MTVNKKVTVGTVTKPKKTSLVYNRFERCLLENFDTTIEEVKDFEKLLLVSPIGLFILLDSIFKII